MRKVLIREYWGKRFTLSEWDIIAVRVVDNDTYNKRVDDRPNFYSYLNHEAMYNTYKNKYWDKWLAARVARLTKDGNVLSARIDYCRPTQSCWTYAQPLGWVCKWINDIHFDIVKINGRENIHSASEYWKAIANASAKERGIKDTDICTNDPNNKRKDIGLFKERDILEKLERRRRIRAQVEVMQEVANNELTSTPTVN